MCSGASWVCPVLAGKYTPVVVADARCTTRVTADCTAKATPLTRMFALFPTLTAHQGRPVQAQAPSSRVLR